MAHPSVAPLQQFPLEALLTEEAGSAPHTSAPGPPRPEGQGVNPSQWWPFTNGCSKRSW